MDAWRYLMVLREVEIEEQERRQRSRIQQADNRRKADLFDGLSTAEFVKLYRLPQQTVRKFIEEIRDDMPQTTRRSAISVESKVLAALRFFATGSYQGAVGDNDQLAMSQPSVSRCINEVCAAVNARAAHRHIKFPSVQAERDAIKQRFLEATGFPGVIGAIDCSHFSVLRPAQSELRFMNKKGIAGINVQIISDYDLRILNINAQYPGSATDGYIWRNCAVRKELVRRYAAGERGEFIIGDSGYVSESWLLVPIANAIPETAEANFSEVHEKARCCVDRCFQLLKARFRCLLKHRTLHYSPEKVALMVNTCAVLHNLALEQGVPDPEPLLAAELVQESEIQDSQFADDFHGNVFGPARQVREKIVKQLWQARSK